MAQKPKVDKVEATKRLMAALMRMKPKQQAEMRVRKTVLKKQPEVVPPKNDLDDIPFEIDRSHLKR